MAGNIIPAIATTNAVIAGLIVLEGLKILSGELESCRTVSSATMKCFHCLLLLPSHYAALSFQLSTC